MTSYIASPSVATAPRTSIFPASDLVPGLFAVWTLPLSAFQIWAHGWASLVRDGEPEEDRDQPSSQLPVPNPLQQAKDKKLFA